MILLNLQNFYLVQTNKSLLSSFFVTFLLPTSTSPALFGSISSTVSFLSFLLPISSKSIQFNGQFTSSSPPRQSTTPLHFDAFEMHFCIPQTQVMPGQSSRGTFGGSGFSGFVFSKSQFKYKDVRV